MKITLVNFLKEIANNWSQDKISSLAAGLAYYTIFSLGPLLILSIAIASMVFDSTEVRTLILKQISATLGETQMHQIEQMITNLKPNHSWITKIITTIILLFGASGFFGALQTGLNKVWGVMPKPNQGIVALIKERFLSFTMVLGIGFLLLVSLIFSVIVASLSQFINQFLPEVAFFILFINFVLSIGGITLLFAMIFKYLPDVEMKWREVWLAAFFTALFFTLGKFLLGLYLSYSNIGKSFGSAGSLIIILVWIYYAAQILLTGAEFSKVLALEKGKTIKPKKNAQFEKGTRQTFTSKKSY